MSANNPMNAFYGMEFNPGDSFTVQLMMNNQPCTYTVLENYGDYIVVTSEDCHFSKGKNLRIDLPTKGCES